MKRIYTALSYLIGLFLLADRAYGQPCFKVSNVEETIILCRQNAAKTIQCVLKGKEKQLLFRTIQITEDSKFKELKTLTKYQMPGFQKRFISRYSYCAPGVAENQKYINAYDFITHRIHAFSILDIKQSMKIYKEKDVFVIGETGRWAGDSIYAVLGKEKSKIYLIIWNKRDSSMKNLEVIDLNLPALPEKKLYATIIENKYYVFKKEDNKVYFYDFVNRKAGRKTVPVKEALFEGKILFTGELIGLYYKKDKENMIVLCDKNFSIKEVKTSRFPIVGYDKGRLIVLKDEKLCYE